MEFLIVKDVPKPYFTRTREVNWSTLPFSQMESGDAIAFAEAKSDKEDKNETASLRRYMRQNGINGGDYITGKQGNKLYIWKK